VLTGAFCDWSADGALEDRDAGGFPVFHDASDGRFPLHRFKFRNDAAQGDTRWHGPDEELRSVAVIVRDEESGAWNWLTRADAAPVLMSTGPVDSDGGAQPWCWSGTFNAWGRSGSQGDGDRSVARLALPPGTWRLKLCRPPPGGDACSAAAIPDGLWEWGMHGGLAADPAADVFGVLPAGDGGATEHVVVVSPLCAGATARNPDARCALLSALQALHSCDQVREAVGPPAAGGDGWDGGAAAAAKGAAPAADGDHPSRDHADVRALLRPWCDPVLAAAAADAEHGPALLAIGSLRALSGRVGPLPAWWLDPVVSKLRREGVLTDAGCDARTAVQALVELINRARAAHGDQAPLLVAEARALPSNRWGDASSTASRLLPAHDDDDEEAAGAALEHGASLLLPVDVTSLEDEQVSAVVHLPPGGGAHARHALSVELQKRWAASGVPAVLRSMPSALVLCLGEAVAAASCEVPDRIVLGRLHASADSDVAWGRAERTYLARAVILRHGAEGDPDRGHWTCARAPGANTAACDEALRHRDAIAAAGSPDDIAAAEASAAAAWVHVDDEAWSWLGLRGGRLAPGLPGEATVAAVVLESLEPERLWT